MLEFDTGPHGVSSVSTAAPHILAIVRSDGGFWG
jgi:hypothetical protein